MITAEVFFLFGQLPESLASSRTFGAARPEMASSGVHHT